MIESIMGPVKVPVKVNEGRRQPRRKRIATPFAQNLKKILEDRGISIRGAAEICGVNQAMVHAWINGSQPHDFRAVLKLCKALKCDFQWLLTSSHPEVSLKEMSLQELFHIESEPTLNGLFQIEVKRMRRRIE